MRKRRKKNVCMSGKKTNRRKNKRLTYWLKLYLTSISDEFTSMLIVNNKKKKKKKKKRKCTIHILRKKKKKNKRIKETKLRAQKHLSNHSIDGFTGCCCRGEEFELARNNAWIFCFRIFKFTSTKARKTTNNQCKEYLVQTKNKNNHTFFTRIGSVFISSLAYLHWFSILFSKYISMPLLD